MTFSKNILVPVLSLAVLAACDGRKGPNGLDSSTFQVDSVAIATSGQKKVSSTSVIADSWYQFKACLKDLASRKSIQHYRFSVGDGKTEQETETDNDGCLTWYESHRISTAVGQEHLIKLVRYIKGKQAFTGTIQVPIAINPWDTSTIYDLLRSNPAGVLELSENPSFTQEVVKQETLGPQAAEGLAETLIKQVDLSNFLGYAKDQTEITSLLGLHPANRYVLKLSPQFIHYNVWGDRSYLDMRGGEFLVHILIIREGSLAKFQPSDLVAEYHGSVTVNGNGEVTQNIVLHINDLPASLNRNQMLVFFEPTGDATPVARRGAFIGYVPPIKGTGFTVTLDTLDKGGPEAYDKAMIASQTINAKTSAVQLLSRDERFSPVEQGSELLAVVGKSGAARSAVLKAYCSRLYATGQMIERPRTGVSSWNPWASKTVKMDALKSCLSSPDSFVVANTRELVEKVLSKPRLVPVLSQPRKITVSRALTYTTSDSVMKGETQTATAGHTVDLGASFDILKAVSKVTSWAGLDFSAGYGVKASFGDQWYYTRQVGTTTEGHVSAGVSLDQTINVDPETYDLDVNVRSCVLLTGLYSRRAFYACGQQTAQKTIRESYYLIYQTQDASALKDADDPRMLRMLVRGEDNYQQFEKLLTSGNAMLEFNKLSEMPETQPGLLPDFRTNQDYPGFVSMPAK